jgi:hypothetical protein
MNGLRDRQMDGQTYKQIYTFTLQSIDRQADRQAVLVSTDRQS